MPSRPSSVTAGMQPAGVGRVCARGGGSVICDRRPAARQHRAGERAAASLAQAAGWAALSSAQRSVAPLRCARVQRRSHRWRNAPAPTLPLCASPRTAPAPGPRMPWCASRARQRTRTRPPPRLRLRHPMGRCGTRAPAQPLRLQLTHSGGLPCRTSAPSPHFPAMSPPPPPPCIGPCDMCASSSVKSRLRRLYKHMCVRYQGVVGGAGAPRGTKEKGKRGAEPQVAQERRAPHARAVCLVHHTGSGMGCHGDRWLGIGIG